MGKTTLSTIFATQTPRQALRMGQIMAGNVAALVIFLVILAVLVAVAIYVIGKVRARQPDESIKVSDMLTKFEELHSQGELSDEEYRTIKAMLADRWQQELNSTDEPR